MKTLKRPFVFRAALPLLGVVCALGCSARQVGRSSPASVLSQDRIPARILVVMPQKSESVILCPTGDLAALRPELGHALMDAITRNLTSRYSVAQVAAASAEGFQRFSVQFRDGSFYDNWDYVALVRMEMRRYIRTDIPPVRTNDFVEFVPRDHRKSFIVSGCGVPNHPEPWRSFEDSVFSSVWSAVESVCARLKKLRSEFKHYAG